MNKKVFLIGMLLGTLPLGVAAQEVLKPDTIHTELRSDFLEELGDTTDLVVAGSGTGNWFISLSGGYIIGKLLITKDIIFQLLMIWFGFYHFLI